MRKTLLALLLAALIPSIAAASICYSAQNRTSGSAPAVMNDAQRSLLFCFVQTKNAYTWSCTSRTCTAPNGSAFSVSIPWGDNGGPVFAIVTSASGQGVASAWLDNGSSGSVMSNVMYYGTQGSCTTYMSPSPVPPFSLSVPAVRACTN